MKRIVAVLLLFVLLVGLFSCRNKKKPEQDVFYQVTFNTSSLPYAATPPEAVTVKAGESVAAPDFTVEPTAGYVVIWVKDTQTKAAYDFSVVVDGDLVLYAVEVPRTYTIVYLLERGTNDKRNPTAFSKATETFALYPPVDTSYFGYRFIKWAHFYDEGSNVESVEKGTEGDIVLRGVFSPVTYTINYVDGGDVNPNPTTYVYGTELTLQAPEKHGFRFLGYTIRYDKNSPIVTELTASFVYENRLLLFGTIGEGNGNWIYLKANWEKIS